MKIHLIKKLSIEEYVLKNAGSRASFEVFMALLSRADWVKPGDIVSTFRNADILGKGSERVIFNIAGNQYRLICKYYFGDSRVHLFVKWIGTHAEYTKLCNEGKQYEINSF